jgi:hypothetical protein
LLHNAFALRMRLGTAIALQGAMSDPPERDDALCDEVLGYLREHPRATDTLEGIAGWWIPRHQVRVGVERVSRALDTLVRRGQVEWVDEGGRRLYRLRGDGDRLPPPDAG